MITRQMEAISMQVTVISNQLHALRHGMFTVKEVKNTCSATGSTLKTKAKAGTASD